MIRCINKNIVLSQRVAEAKRYISRARGMLRRDFSTFDAMLFRKNNSIHMFFMGISLDILFLDKGDRVTGIRHSLKPWRIAVDWSAHAVIELPAGQLSRMDIEVGDSLEISVDTTL